MATKLPKSKHTLTIRTSTKPRSAIELVKALESKEAGGAVYFQVPARLRAAFIESLGGELSMARTLRLLMESWVLHEAVDDGEAARFLSILERTRTPGAVSERKVGRPARDSGPEREGR